MGTSAPAGVRDHGDRVAPDPVHVGDQPLAPARGRAHEVTSRDGTQVGHRRGALR
jgi:hypothetical protein